jgi:hypothetical protein
MVCDEEGFQAQEFPTDYAPNKVSRDKLIDILGFPVKVNG